MKHVRRYSSLKYSPSEECVSSSILFRKYKLKISEKELVVSRLSPRCVECKKSQVSFGRYPFFSSLSLSLIPCSNYFHFPCHLKPHSGHTSQGNSLLSYDYVAYIRRTSSRKLNTVCSSLVAVSTCNKVSSYFLSFFSFQ